LELQIPKNPGNEDVPNGALVARDCVVLTRLEGVFPDLDELQSGCDSSFSFQVEDCVASIGDYICDIVYTIIYTNITIPSNYICEIVYTIICTNTIPSSRGGPI